MTDGDHDLLIEIRAITKINQENFIKHCEQDSEAQGILSKSVSALHRRIDWLMISGIMAIVLMAVTWIIKR